MANQIKGYVKSLGAASVVAAALVLPAAAQADEIWVTPTYQQDTGGLSVASNVFWPVTPGGIVRFAWSVPNDLQTFTSAKVALIPGSAAPASAVNIFVCPAQNGDVIASGSCAGPFAQSFSSVANRLVEVEIGSLIASRIGTPGANYLAVIAYTTPTTSTDHFVGLRFTYTPKAPAGIPTLAANAFTGTQTAPSFSGSFTGNGSGLTNLPFPAGAATLGTNTFTGTQTAPAFSGSFSGSFSGNGANLINLPFPVGAATLGANTFTATQTISGGNLELAFPSTASNGAITKGGARFLFETGGNNTFLGREAGTFAGTGIHNTAVGTVALASTTTGDSNTAVGSGALTNDTDGRANTASGVSAMYSNLSGASNTAIGKTALFANTSGNNNTAIGADAGSASTGSNNIYLGANVTGAGGESNTMYLGKQGVQTRAFIGGVRGVTTGNADALPVVIDSAGQLGTAGGFATLGANTFSGTQTAPAFAGDGSALTNLPFPAGAATLGANTFSGTQIAPIFAGAFIGNGSGLFSLPFPAGAATLLTNTFTGTQTIDTGNIDLDPSTTTAGNITKNGTLFLHNFGTNNLFLGTGAGNTAITTGLAVQNVGVGPSALHTLTTGNSNTATGYLALQSNQTGSLNTAAGSGALATANGGTQNTAVGASALGNTTSSSSNTAVGASALANNTIGASNIAIGWGAGLNATSGSNNIYLGTMVQGAAGEQNTMYLGKVGTQTKTFVAGVRGITTVNPDAIPVVVDSAGQFGTISSSIRFKDDVHDMGDTSRRLLNLRPVTFRYTQPFANGVRPVQYGLIAEEVAAVFPELAVRGADGQVETVHYETLNVLLVNEVQKQQRRIEALEQKLNELLERQTRP